VAVARLALLVTLLGGSAIADDQRAHVNYMLHCQGCHLPAAEGVAGRVPPMNNFVGYFLHSTEGREFLIRVPGVAQSALNDDEVAELMNWLMNTFSGEQLPETYAPFTAAEVAELRSEPIADPDTARQALLADIARHLPPLAAALPHNN
jgi:mono/diheme cytochrome c family protein